MLVPDARAALSSREELERRGRSPRQVLAEVRRGALIRVDRGWYADAQQWRTAHSEGRHLMRVVAAERRRTGESELVFSHASAAVLWGLPLFRAEPHRVHLSGRAASGHVRASEPLVARHQVEVAPRDTTVRHGIVCTGLARTVADVLRSASVETGLSLADAALRRVAWSPAGYDVGVAESLRREVAKRLPRGGRGVRAARWVLELADGRAASPGESVSRLYLVDLGFAVPRLQVPIEAPGSGCFFVDFALDDVGAWGEYDGEGKYIDPALRGAGVGIEQVVLAEKQREDWIRGTTSRRFVRWGKADIASPAHLAARLRAFGIHPPGFPPSRYPAAEPPRSGAPRRGGSAESWRLGGEEGEVTAVLGECIREREPQWGERDDESHIGEASRFHGAGSSG